MVARTRIELVIDAYQATVIPFNYPAINSGGLRGIRIPPTCVTGMRAYR